MALKNKRSSTSCPTINRNSRSKNNNKLIFFFKIRNILNENTVHEFHLKQKFLVVVTEDIRYSCARNLDKIFEMLWSNGLINAHVLCQDEIHFWSFYTFMPYQRNCINLEHFKLTTFTPSNFTKNMTLTMDELYPKKLGNFNACTLFVAPSLIRPFVMFANTTDEEKYKGIDIDILTQISKKLNFVIDFKRISDGTGHGVILQNGTVTGSMNQVNILYEFVLYFKNSTESFAKENEMHQSVFVQIGNV